MPTLSASLTGFVPGDHISLRRTIDREGGGVSDEVLPNGVNVDKAWFTVKERSSDDDADALVQKEITSVSSADGEIENTGAGNVDPVLRFDLLPADTEAIGAVRTRYYDVQVLTSAGKIYTPEAGRTKATTEQITLDED